jgi:cytochrome c553
MRMPALIAGLIVLWVLPLWADPPRGEAIYREQCARCHGASGEGTKDYPDALAGDKSVEQLADLIARTMPEDKDVKCSGDDARDVAAYLHEAFYSPAAQLRANPVRVELSRLTVRQYQNSVTDLIGSFRSPGNWGGERGLRGEYYAARKTRRAERLIERTDPEVKFDFGEGTPGGDKFNVHQFSIEWEGSVFAPDTGDYEFVVRTEHAARLWINDLQTPLIDASVKSGDDVEFRGSIRLLGGRAYPLKLDFTKAKQGVEDQKKYDKVLPASISLSWTRPHHELEVIPARCLSTNPGQQSFVLATPFPPDDRSMGYERGTSISKAWDQATTDAAIEVTGYVSDRLPELAGVPGDSADHELKLREFCQKFAERAFRRPLTDEQKQLYIDRQFTSAPDLKVAVKRVLLLVLKSPRFLYQEIGSEQPDAFDVASRISLGIWDSLPDPPLLEAAARGELSSREQVVAQVQRMSTDLRAKAKLREFLLGWLRVAQPPDLSKDPSKFPEFSPAVVSDLRTSLELSLDEILSSDAADFRQLLLSDSFFLNGRLAGVYGIDMPGDAPFEKIALESDRRSGLISHPYLLAAFAYTATSSPIHRGVFISRSLLGRTLRPPPEAVAPLAPDLHADLTTRERVALQTKAEACMTCHSMINPLGFTLEHFDALGRYREVEKNRPVDAVGSYVTRSGQETKFHGAKELAHFLAGSEETYNALVQQLFHYAVKQPIRAYGPQTLPNLRSSLVQNEFNLRKLLVEIVAASATSQLP